MSATHAAPSLDDVRHAHRLVAQARPNRRDLAKQRTLAKVRDGARFMFANLGFEATTIRDLARRIGMSTGAVFACYPDKAAIWADVMASPPPTLHLAEEIALLTALRPNWRWIVRYTGSEHVAEVHGPDWKPLQPDGAPMFVGRSASPGEALRQARLAAERHDGRRAQ